LGRFFNLTSTTRHWNSRFATNLAVRTSHDSCFTLG